MERVNRELGDGDRTAYFVSALTLAWPDGHCESVEGRVYGKLAWPAGAATDSAMTRCSFPMATASPSARWTRPRSTGSATAPTRSPACGAVFRLMALSDQGPGFGIYVHWPFCLAKCPYCDFNSHVRAGVDHARWREALLAELDYYAALTPGRTVTSIFFGGGTPSLMEPATVAAVIERIGRHWALTPGLEITLEANPTSVEAGRFAGFRAAGVNRVSLGIQALDDASLKFLGRAHSASEALGAIGLAARHFDRFSFDLIYARPGQSVADWEAELRARPGPCRRAPVGLSAYDRGRHAVPHPAQQGRLRHSGRRVGRRPLRGHPGLAGNAPACRPTRSPTTPVRARSRAIT